MLRDAASKCWSRYFSRRLREALRASRASQRAHSRAHLSTADDYCPAPESSGRNSSQPGFAPPPTQLLVLESHSSKERSRGHPNEIVHRHGFLREQECPLCFSECIQPNPLVFDLAATFEDHTHALPLSLFGS